MRIANSANYQIDTTSKIISGANVNRVALIIQVKLGGQATFKFDTTISVDGAALTDGIDITGTIILDNNVPQGNIYMLAPVATVVNITEVLELPS